MLGTTELLVILLIIIVVFGSTKLPQLGDALGKSIKNFKSAVGDDEKTSDKQISENKSEETVSQEKNNSAE